MPGRMESVENLHEAAVPGARIRGWFSTLPTAPWKSLTRFPQFHSPDDDDPLLRTSKTRGHFYRATEGDTSIELRKGTFLLGVDISPSGGLTTARLAATLINCR